MEQERGDCREEGKNVRNRQRDPDRERMVREEAGQDPHAGQQTEELAQDREEGRRPGVPDGLEVGGRHHVEPDAPEHAVREPQVARREGEEGPVGTVREDPHDRLRHEHLRERGERAAGGRHGEAEQQHAPHARVAAGAPAVADDRSESLLDAKDGHQEKHHHHLEDAERGDLRRGGYPVNRPLRERDLHRNVDQAPHQLLQGRRKPDARRPPRIGPVEADPAQPQPHRAVPRTVVGERPQAGDEHGDHRRPGRTRR